MCLYDLLCHVVEETVIEVNGCFLSTSSLTTGTMQTLADIHIDSIIAGDDYLQIVLRDTSDAVKLNSIRCELDRLFYGEESS